MIPKECERLAEVDFPIAVVSKHAAKEKSKMKYYFGVWGLAVCGICLEAVIVNAQGLEMWQQRD